MTGEEKAGREYLAELMWENAVKQRAKLMAKLLADVVEIMDRLPIDWIKCAKRLAEE